jgi:hypothetical protein
MSGCEIVLLPQSMEYGLYVAWIRVKDDILGGHGNL